MEHGYENNYYTDYIGPTCTVYKDMIFWKARTAHSWKKGLTKKQAVRRALNDFNFMKMTEYEVMSLHEAKKYYAP